MANTKKQFLDAIAAAQKVGALGPWRQAVEAAGAAFPEDPVVTARWAQYCHASGDQKTAQHKIISAYDQAAGDPDLRLVLCDMMFEMALRRLAYKKLPPISAGESWQQTFVRIKILREQKDDVAVGQCCMHLVKTASLTSEQWRQISNMAYAAKQMQAALAAYENSLEGRQGAVGEIVRLAELYMENDDVIGAKNALTRAPQTQGNQVDVRLLIMRAKCARKLGESDAARATYHQVIDQDPKRFSAWQALSELAKRDELPALVDRFEEVLAESEQHHPNALPSYFALGRMHERLDRHEKAFAALEKGNDFFERHLNKSGRSYDVKNRDKVRERTLSLFRDHPATTPRARPNSGARTPIFIVGMPRSGTSLLERIIGSFAGVALGGENKALAQLSMMKLRQFQMEDGPHPAQFTAAEWQALAAEYWARTPVEGSVVTDKLPQNYKALGWAFHMFPDAPIIYLKRDPRDIGWSIYKRAMRPGFTYAFNQRHIAHAIYDCRQYVAGWKKIAPHRILEVEFESLVRNPEEETQRIAAFCGMEWVPECLHPEKLDAPSFTISEHQVRQPINEKGIGRWRAYERFLVPLVSDLKAYGMI